VSSLNTGGGRGQVEALAMAKIMSSR
jgi:hypothetical protein